MIFLNVCVPYQKTFSFVSHYLSPDFFTYDTKPIKLLRTWTAPTPSQSPRDPPRETKNADIENSGKKDSVIKTFCPNVKENPEYPFLYDFDRKVPAT